MFSAAFGGGFPLTREWRWYRTHFTVAYDNIVTAQGAGRPTVSAPALPSGTPPDGTYGRYVAFATEEGAGRIRLTLVPATVGAVCAPLVGPCGSPGREVNLTVSGYTPTLYPLLAGEASASPSLSYITGPLWPLAGIALGWGDIKFGNYYVGNYWDNPTSYSKNGASPWYIPSSLIAAGAGFASSPNEPVTVTFRGGFSPRWFNSFRSRPEAATAVTALCPHEGVGDDPIGDLAGRPGATEPSRPARAGSQHRHVLLGNPEERDRPSTRSAAGKSRNRQAVPEWP